MGVLGSGSIAVAESNSLRRCGASTRPTRPPRGSLGVVLTG